VRTSVIRAVATLVGLVAAPAVAESPDAGSDKQSDTTTEKTEAEESSEPETSEEEPAGFRGHPIGTSREAYIEAEGKPDKRQDGDLLYTDEQLSSMGVTIRVGFLDGELVGGSYKFTETYRNKDKFVRDFRRVNELLREKYGPPDNNMRERDDNKDTDIGTELMADELFFSDTWIFPKDDLRIVHLLTEFGDEVGHIIAYDSYSSTAVGVPYQDHQELQKEEAKGDQ
jgi:hypothetical protein